jgi:membrane fusion protein (multidrug efflux system)
MNMADEKPAPSTGTQSVSASGHELAPGGGSVYRPPVSRKRGNRRRDFIVVAIVVIVLAVGGVFLWRYLDSYESTDDAQGDVHLYPVSARIPGYVVKVNVEDNQWVEQGAVLVEIDPRDFEVALSQAQGNLASAEATARSLNITVPITTVNTTSQIQSTSSDIDNANAGVIAAQRQLTAAHAQLEEAQANDVRAQDDLQRYKLLVDKREVAPQVYDQALATAAGSAGIILLPTV